MWRRLSRRIPRISYLERLTLTICSWWIGPNKPDGKNHKLFRTAPWRFQSLPPLFTTAFLATKVSMLFKMRKRVKHRHSKRTIILDSSWIPPTTSTCLCLTQMNFLIVLNNLWKSIRSGSPGNFKIQGSFICVWPIFQLIQLWVLRPQVTRGYLPCWVQQW